jgi:hypothetical protein
LGVSVLKAVHLPHFVDCALCLSHHRYLSLGEALNYIKEEKFNEQKEEGASKQITDRSKDAKKGADKGKPAQEANTRGSRGQATGAGRLSSNSSTVSLVSLKRTRSGADLAGNVAGSEKDDLSRAGNVVVARLCCVFTHQAYGTSMWSVWFLFRSPVWWPSVIGVCMMLRVEVARCF